MRHKLDDPLRHPYAEADVYEVLADMDHRMIQPRLHPDWKSDLSTRLPLVITNIGVYFVEIPAEQIAQGLTISIDIETLEPGDDLLLELQRRLPPGSKVIIEPQPSLPASPLNIRPITDALHWPIRWPTQADHPDFGKT